MTWQPGQRQAEELARRAEVDEALARVREGRDEVAARLDGRRTPGRIQWDDVTRAKFDAYFAEELARLDAAQQERQSATYGFAPESEAPSEPSAMPAPAEPEPEPEPEPCTACGQPDTDDRPARSSSCQHREAPAEAVDDGPALRSALGLCDVCGLPVASAYVTRTGQRRHGPCQAKAGAA